jgi:hypothetical protein
MHISVNVAPLRQTAIFDCITKQFHLMMAAIALSSVVC